MKKRIVSFLMALVLLFSMLPVNVLAQTTDTGAETDPTYYAEGATIWLPEGVTPTQEEYPVDTARGDQWVNTGSTKLELICGVESHGHTYKCAETCDKLHTHSDDCYAKVFNCGNTEHTHSDSCDTTVWSCNLEESSGHAHGTECFALDQLNCDKTETTGHAHVDACYAKSEEATCGLNEGDGAHVHDTAACYAEDGSTLNCTEDTVGHVHGDACYPVVTVCGLNEGDGAYAHTEACYVADETPDCGLNESDGAHSHEADVCTSEVKKTCGLEEHTHTVEVCGAYTQGELTCTLDDTHVCVTEGCEADCAEAHHTESCNGTTLLVMWGVANYGLTTADEGQGLPLHFFIAAPGQQVDPDGDYQEYRRADWGTEDEENGAFVMEGIHLTNNINSTQGIRNANNESDIIQYVHSWSTGEDAASFKNFGDSINVFGTNYSSSQYEIKWVTICYRQGYRGGVSYPCYCRNVGDHVHIDGILVRKDTTTSALNMTKVIPEAQNAAETFNFNMYKLMQDSNFDPLPDINYNVDPIPLSATIAAGSTSAAITGSGQKLEYGYYKVVEDSTKWSVGEVEIDATNGYDPSNEQDAVYVYIAPNGSVSYSLTYNGDYVSASNVNLINKRDNATVSYQWSGLPENLTSLPASDTVPVGDSHDVNRSYYQGYRIANPDHDDPYYYVFSGWESYTNDDGSEPMNPANPGTITVDSDTVIHGEWIKTEEEVSPENGHITVTKTFDGLTEMPQNYYIDVYYENTDGQPYYVLNAQTMGTTTTNSAGDLVWTYGHLPVSANGDYILIEKNYQEPGYIVDPTSSASGNYLNPKTGTIGTDTITVEVKLPLDTDGIAPQDSILAGDVTFTNTYEKQEATANSYPTISVLKYKTGTVEPLEGAEFTLSPVWEYTYAEGATEPTKVENREAWSDAFKNQTFAPMISNDRGVATSGELLPGVYKLEETKAPDGCVKDSAAYYVYVMYDGENTELKPVTVTDSEGKETTVDKFVTTTIYEAHVGLEGDKENHPNYNTNANALIVYNTEILGQLTFSKTFVDKDGKAIDLPDSATITLHVTGPNNYDQYVTLGDMTDEEDTVSWTKTLTGLRPGTYTVTETNTSIHGYNWESAKITVNGKTVTGKSVEVEVGEDATTANPSLDIAIENTYYVWKSAEFVVEKVDATSWEHLSGITFTLYSDYTFQTPVHSVITDADGEAWFRDLTLTEGVTSQTYYLKEINYPHGYEALDNAMYWEVVVSLVTDTATNTSTYDINVTPKNGAPGEFYTGTDTLLVTNTRKTGSLTITKDFGADNEMPEGLTEVYALVTGPNGYSTTVTMEKPLLGSTWTSEPLTGLAWGEYTIQEVHAEVDGYILKTLYNGQDTDSATVTINADNVSAEQSVRITNTYDKQEATVHNKTYFNILKHDSVSHAPIQGAVFQLFADEACTTALTGVPFATSSTTNADGWAYFGDLHLLDGLQGTYYLKEVTAPEGYVLSDTVWKVVLSEDGLEAVTTLDKQHNIFETVYDWIVNIFGGTTDSEGNPTYGSDSALNGNTLTVHNTRKDTKLTVKKLVEYYVEGQKVTDVNTIQHLINNVTANGTDLVPNSYSITTNINGTTKTISLADGGETEYTINYNESYSAVEDITSTDAFVLTSITDSNGDGSTAIKNGISGTVGLNDLAEGIEVVFTNRYSFNQFDEHDHKTDEEKMTACLEFEKVTDAGENLAGAEFTLYKQDASGDLAPTGLKVTTDDTGVIHFDIHEAGTYVIRETVTPAGYKTAGDVTVVVEQTYEIFDETVGNTVTRYIVKKLVVTSVTGVTNNKIVNETNPGTLTMTKAFSGLDEGDDANARITMHVHGPIVYGADGKPTAESFDKVVSVDMTRNANGQLEAVVPNLEKNGIYLVHEAFASLHGYNWKRVSYSSGTVKTIDGIEYREITVANTSDAQNIAMTVTNEYDKWSDGADFYVHKTDSVSGETMSGVIFTLHTSANCADDCDCTTVTTDDTGHAHFTGLAINVDDTTTYDSVNDAKTEYTKTFYLKETTPANYQPNNNVYEVVLTWKNVSTTGVAEWEYDLTVNDPAFDYEHDELVIKNTPILGKIVITKDFGEGSALTGKSSSNPDGVESVSVHMTGPDGYSQYYTLNAANNWTAEVTGLRMGTYSIAESDANRLGYTWTVAYSMDGAAAATLDKPTDFVEVNLATTDVDRSIKFVNTYTKNRASDVITPAELSIYKTDDHGTPLSGAKFTLYTDSACTTVYDYAETAAVVDGNATEDSDGIYTISNIIGDDRNITHDNKGAKTYYLKETQAPAGYQASDTVWQISVSADGTTLKLDELNQHTGFFETIINWLRGENTNYTYDNGRLVVVNEPKETKLTVKKTVQYMLDGTIVTDAGVIADLVEKAGDSIVDAYTFTTSIDGVAQTGYQLKNGETKEFTIDYNSTYSVDETVAQGAVYVKTLPDNAEGTVSELNGTDPEPVTVEVVNTYSFWSYDEHEETLEADPEACLIFKKVDAMTQAALAGATFKLTDANGTKLDEQTTAGDGILHFHVNAAGTYYLTEVEAPDGYKELTSATKIDVTSRYVEGVDADGQPVLIEELVASVERNALGKGEVYLIGNFLKPVSITAEKVWDDNDYYDRPDSVKVQLMKDGKKEGAAVTLNEENKWTHTWDNLDAYATWTVEEEALDKDLGYTVTYSDLEDGKITITNTRVTKTIELTLKKVWKGYGVAIPKSISVDVYRNGVKWDTVKITRDNDWKATYTITDNAEWEFEEVKVPGFWTRKPKYDPDTNTITITNFASPIPKTGDYIMIAAGVMVAAGAALIVLLVMAKKKNKKSKT